MLNASRVDLRRASVLANGVGIAMQGSFPRELAEALTTTAEAADEMLKQFKGRQDFLKGSAQ